MGKFTNKSENVEGGSGVRRMKFKPDTISYVRIIKDEYESAWKHFFQNENGEIRSVICLGKKNCPLCKRGNKATLRYFFNVIDKVEKKENKGDFKVKLMEVGSQICDEIKSYCCDDEYGDPTKYNFKIERKGSTKNNTKYRTRPALKKNDITKKELETINKDSEDGGAYDLSIFIEKLTKDEVLSIINGEDRNNDEDNEDEEKEKSKKKKGKKITEEEDFESDENSDDDEDNDEIDLNKEIEDLENEEEEEKENPKKSKKKKVKDMDEDEEW